ncbi:MAG: hypothetical protein AB7O78_05595 [Thermoleophilia bacterium]
MTRTAIEPTTAMVGYQVREADGRTVAGEVDGVRPSGIRIHKIPHQRGRVGYVPVEAIATVDRATNTIRLRDGIRLAAILDAPEPPRGSGEDWHLSGDWWADLLGHYGLYDAEGRGSEPFLHPGQK